MKTFFNLPEKIKFCKLCVMSNQRPSSFPEYKHKFDRKGAKYLNFDKNGICDACNVAIQKKSINWQQREKELVKLLNIHRSKNNDYDCIVPGSGGKDSVYAAHILKYKYGMNPLTITWPPILYTEYGYKNYLNWINKGGFDNITYRPNGNVMRKLTNLSIKNLLHPFQTFVFGQKNLAAKIANKYQIPLVFYGENETEYGNPIAENNSSLRKKLYYSIKNKNNAYLAGLPIKDLIKSHNLSVKDLSIFLPMEAKSLSKTKLEIHFLGYYLKWVPQEAYYYSVKNTDFKSRPFRTQGTYSKYNSIDDKIDDLHYYTMFIKYGFGRASHDCSQEIRNNHLIREDGKRLVKKFDGEFPNIYFDEIMDFIDMKKDEFFKLCNKFRSPHIWKKKGRNYTLRHTVNEDGADD
ncbi:N-acetyl sugar amidotransferase [Candidatus Pelagibacter sp.]|jgi:N-acetyl sugar amidotransferase|nr:N-acetyl sugar amidotransferase [Candidatus Pelagibacter sp.]